MTAFVLGNGRSRAPIDVNQLMLLGKVYGCNALYRSHAPHVLVATDRTIAEEIQKTGYAQKNKFYTRRPILGLGGVDVPSQYFGFSSGPLALGIAALDRHREIYLLGFDMGPSEVNKFNNLYADTPHYKRSHDPPTYTGNWSRQIQRICQDFPRVRFVRVHGTTTAEIPDFRKLPNLEKMAFADFVTLVNKPKDL